MIVVVRRAARLKSGNMLNVGKGLMVLGAVLVAAGLLVYIFARLGFRGLPGDIHYTSPNVRIYFPIVTCLVISAVLTLFMWLWQWLSRR